MLTFAFVTNLQGPLIPKKYEFREGDELRSNVTKIPGIEVKFGNFDWLVRAGVMKTEYVVFLPASLRLTAEALRILETNMRTGFKPNAVIGWAVYDPSDEGSKMTAFMQTPLKGLPKRRPGWRIFNRADFRAPVRCLDDLLNDDREAPFLTYVSQSKPLIQDLPHREFLESLTTPLKSTFDIIPVPDTENRS